MSQCFGTKRTHSRVPGLKGEALFSNLQSFFSVSADRRLVQIHIYLFVLYEFTYAYLHVIYM